MTRALSFCATALVGVVGMHNPATVQDAITEEFIQRVNAYIEFRSDFTANVPAVTPDSDWASIEAWSNILAMSLRAARPEARVGDIFSPRIAPGFRERIQTALWEHTYA